MTARSKTEAIGGASPKVPVAPTKPQPVTEQQLAEMGEGEFAYLKSMRSEEVRRLFPQLPPLSPGQELFALFGADGAPILLADSRATALANAWEQELKTVSLH